MNRELSTEERLSAAHHCRVAADKYDENVEMLKQTDDTGESDPAYLRGLMDQFRYQAQTARALARKLED